MTQHITQATLVASDPSCWFVWFCQDESEQIGAPECECFAANEERWAA